MRGDVELVLVTQIADRDELEGNRVFAAGNGDHSRLIAEAAVVVHHESARVQVVHDQGVFLAGELELVAEQRITAQRRLKKEYVVVVV